MKNPFFKLYNRLKYIFLENISIDTIRVHLAWIDISNSLNLNETLTLFELAKIIVHKDFKNFHNKNVKNENVFFFHQDSFAINVLGCMDF